MIAGLADGSRPPISLLLRQLLNPRLSARLLKAMGPQGQLLEPVLRNTISPTMLRSGSKINVIPSLVTLEMDTRMLPGFVPEQMVQEVRAIVGPEVEIEVLRSGPSLPAQPDLSQLPLLAGVLRDLDPDGIPVPYMAPGTTDARHFNQLGIQTYGFTPMNLPPDFQFIQTVHGTDERVPIDAVHFGTQAIYDVLCRYGQN